MIEASLCANVVTKCCIHCIDGCLLKVCDDGGRIRLMPQLLTLINHCSPRGNCPGRGGQMTWSHKTQINIEMCDLCPSQKVWWTSDILSSHCQKCVCVCVLGGGGVGGRNMSPITHQMTPITTLFPKLSNSVSHQNPSQITSIFFFIK